MNSVVFYITAPSSQIVNLQIPTGFKVITNGEMWIRHYASDNKISIVNVAEDLIRLGIDTDEKFEEAKRSKSLVIVTMPFFTVIDNNSDAPKSEPLHSVSEVLDYIDKVQ